ncbi:MAG: hypothetical protein IKR69_03425 [Bacteroidales bacterium]|nr:hypothetical protein [Bacteroidales bacterium]
MNNTFNGGRFLNFFLYDIKSIGRRHAFAAMMLGGAGLVLYAISVVLSLVFSQKWGTPPEPARWVVFSFASLAFVFYQTQTYGFLTEKRASSAYLMLPASNLEKFLSMMLNTLIVLPVLFFGMYFLIDWVLSLLDPNYGATLASRFYTMASSVIEGASLAASGPIVLHIVLGFLGSAFVSLLYFLLCGLLFQKRKVGYAILILLGINIVFSPLGMWIFSSIGNSVATMTMSEEVINSFANSLIFTSHSVHLLLIGGLGTGIYFRLKNIAQ